MFGEEKSTKTLRLPPKALIGGGGALPCCATLRQKSPSNALSILALTKPAGATDADTNTELGGRLSAMAAPTALGELYVVSPCPFKALKMPVGALHWKSPKDAIAQRWTTESWSFREGAARLMASANKRVTNSSVDSSFNGVQGFSSPATSFASAVTAGEPLADLRATLQSQATRIRARVPLANPGSFLANALPTSSRTEAAWASASARPDQSHQPSAAGVSAENAADANASKRQAFAAPPTGPSGVSKTQPSLGCGAYEP